MLDIKSHSIQTPFWMTTIRAFALAAVCEGKRDLFAEPQSAKQTNPSDEVNYTSQALAGSLEACYCLPIPIAQLCTSIPIKVV